MAKDVGHLRQPLPALIVECGLAVARHHADRLRAASHQAQDPRGDVELGHRRRIDPAPPVRQGDGRVLAHAVAAGGGRVGVGIDHRERDLPVELVVAGQQEAGVAGRRPRLVEEGSDLERRLHLVGHGLGLWCQAEAVGRRQVGLRVVRVGEEVAPEDDGHEHNTDDHGAATPAHRRVPNTPITLATPTTAMDAK